MAYVANPRGGATRDYFSVPKAAVDDPAQFNPYDPNLELDTNQYKAYTDSLLYAVLFYAGFQIIKKLSKFQ